MFAGLVCPKVYGCVAICRPLLGTTGTITRIVPLVTKGGGISTGGRDKTYGNYTRGVCVSQWYREHSIKGVPTSMWPRVEESPQVAKVKGVDASQGVGDFPQAR